MIDLTPLFSVSEDERGVTDNVDDARDAAAPGVDDSGEVYVRVYTLADAPICTSYTLNYGQVQ